MTILPHFLQTAKCDKLELIRNETPSNGDIPAAVGKDTQTTSICLPPSVKLNHSQAKQCEIVNYVKDKSAEIDDVVNKQRDTIQKAKWIQTDFNF